MWTRANLIGVLYSDPLKGLQLVFGQSESVYGNVNEGSDVSSQGIRRGRGGCIKDYLEGDEVVRGDREWRDSNGHQMIIVW